MLSQHWLLAGKVGGPLWVMRSRRVAFTFLAWPPPETFLQPTFSRVVTQLGFLKPVCPA